MIICIGLLYDLTLLGCTGTQSQAERGFEKHHVVAGVPPCLWQGLELDALYDPFQHQQF